MEERSISAPAILPHPMTPHASVVQQSGRSVSNPETRVQFPSGAGELERLIPTPVLDCSGAAGRKVQALRFHLNELVRELRRVSRLPKPDTIFVTEEERVLLAQNQRLYELARR